jgi:DNA-binding PadR family transcriptional regulator
MSGQVLRDQQYLVLSAFLPQPTANAYEVWVRLNRRTGSAPKENVISKRLSELAEAGMVKLTRYKRTGSSSREQQVYEATDRGLEYLRMRVAI